MKLSHAHESRLHRMAAAWSLVAAVVILTIVATPHALGSTILGRELSWSMTVPDGWVGGSYYQIETMLQHTADENLRRTLKVVQNTSKNKEAALIHLEDAYLAARRDPSFSTRTLTEITVNFSNTRKDRELMAASEWQEFWQAYQVVAGLDHKGANVDLVSQETFEVHRGMAHAASLRIRLATGGTLYESLIIVAIPSVGQLTFRLQVDSSKYRTRQLEMRQMMRSLRLG